MSDITALVLTAGVGTRLQPLTHVRAKPALPVAGTPMVERILVWLRSQGITHVVLNLHHRPDTITRIVGDGRHLGLHVRYSWENPILGSAGGPRKALDLIDADDFLIVNGDTLCNIEVPALVEQHRQLAARVTMAVVPNPEPNRYGSVDVGQDGFVTGFSRPGVKPESLHFIGVQVVNRDVLTPLPLGVAAESVTEVYPALIREDPRAIRTFKYAGEFFDIGTVGDYFRASQQLALREGLPQLRVGDRSRLAQDASVTDSILWDDVAVGARAVLHQCIVADGVRVPAGARYERVAIVLPSEDAGGSASGPLIVQSF